MVDLVPATPAKAFDAYAKHVGKRPVPKICGPARSVEGEQYRTPAAGNPDL